MKRTVLVSLLAIALPVFAGTSIESVTSIPTPAKAGEPVSVTISSTDADGGMCGMEVEWGDGSVTLKQVGGNHKPFPLTLQHTYAKPGDFRIKASGKRVETYLPCSSQVRYIIKVEGAAPAAADTAKAACPTGWAMKGKATKDGSYTCAPKAKGAKKPEKELACPAGTSYFFSSKSLGCEKAQ